MREAIRIEIIGHTSADVREGYDDLTVYQPGGGVFYAARAINTILQRWDVFRVAAVKEGARDASVPISRSGQPVHATVSPVLAQEFQGLFEAEFSRMEPHYLHSDVYTIFQNIYTAAGREQRLFSTARAVTAAEVRPAECYIITPITPREFDFELQTLHGTIALDIQGFLRRAGPDGTVVRYYDVLPCLDTVTILKLNRLEFQTIFHCAGLSDEEVLRAQVPIIIITDLNYVILKYYDTVSSHEHPRYRHPTGRGDTLLAGFVYFWVLGCGGPGSMQLCFYLLDMLYLS